MTNNTLIACGFWGKLNRKITATVNEITEERVNGVVIHNHGMPIPFSVTHNGESFYACGHRFHFADWTL